MAPTAAAVAGEFEVAAGATEGTEHIIGGHPRAVR